MGIQVISFNCVLKNKIGKVISFTYNRDVLTSIDGATPMLAGLALGLQNLTKGEKRNINLSAQEAYGFYEPSKVILFPKKKIGREVRPGESVSIAGKSGAIRIYVVVQVHQDMVTLDGNHPLAGQDLVFEIEAVEVRDATAIEITESTNVMATQLLH